MSQPRRPSILLTKIQVQSADSPRKSVNFEPHATKRIYDLNDIPTKLNPEKIIKVRQESPATILRSPKHLIHITQSRNQQKCEHLVLIFFQLFDCVCFLPLLIYTTVIKLLYPCIKHIISRISANIHCKTKNIDEFIDSSFLPNNDSLNVKETDVEWLNITKLYTHDCDLNIEDIDIENIIASVQHKQHKWLLSALLNICDHPYLIKKLFLRRREDDESNKFRIRLFDGRKYKWKEIVIDDMIPCCRYTQKPLFIQPKEDEKWLLLLAKSLAKLCGSYCHLMHGDIPFALQTLTGRKVKIYLNTSNDKREAWSEGCMKYNDKSSNKMKRYQVYFDDDAKKYFNHKQLWSVLDAYDKKRALIVAAISAHKTFANLRKVNQIEIVSDESYSVLELKEIGRFRFIQINNRWNYKYDTKYKWNQYPEIMDALNLHLDNMETNTFWIELNDFVSVFNVIYVCPQVKQKIDEKKCIILDVEKDATVCQMSSSCCAKCFTFWCKCHACEVMYPQLWKKCTKEPQSLKYMQSA